MTDWLSSIATRAETDVATVEQVHAKYGVVPEPTIPTPVPLWVSRLHFAGVKGAAQNNEAFDFTWDPAGGIWAIATDELNLRGKSTVIEIIRWALRGRCDLQADVRAWLRDVSVTFMVGGVGLRLRLTCTPAAVEGTYETESGQVVGSFATDEEFERVAAAVMMGRLGLQALAFFQRDGEGGGSRRSQGWPALSDALYIHSTDSLLGDEVMGGLAGRLLQVFLGLPWTSTLAAAKAARDEINARRPRSGAPPAPVHPGLEPARALLAARQADLATLPDIAAQLRRRDSALRNLAAADQAALAAKGLHTQASERLAAAAGALGEDERRLLDVAETGTLRRFFHGLDPKLCPRCDTTVGSQRKAREATAGTCALCGEGSEAAIDHLAVAELEQQVSTLRAARDAAQVEEAQALDALRVAEQRLVDVRREADAATTTADDSGRRALELEVARLTGVVNALETTGVPAEPSTDDDLDAAVIAATVDVTNALQEAGQSDLLASANAAVLALAQRFGIENLEEVRLNRAGQLRLRKGGAATSYSHLTGGEQLRLKVAVALGLLQVGHESHVGRFPGLLLVDAPGGHETNDDDLRSMISGLVETANTLPGLQVFLATAKGAIVDAFIPRDQQRRPNETGYLW